MLRSLPSMIAGADSKKPIRTLTSKKTGGLAVVVELARLQPTAA